ncbi:hypothetical protein [Limimaricola sp.]|uniref:hypothetical protein n=1 Tax=Limimaricola sp. TaxID=2211665 RepID=UPI0040588457
MNRSTLLTATALVLILSVGGRPVGADTGAMAFPIAGLPAVAGGAAPAVARPGQDAPAEMPDAFAFEILEVEEAARGAQVAPRPVATAAAPATAPVAALGRIEPRARTARPLWTRTGIADLTFGRDLDAGRGWTEGRAAFFVEGPLRGGWTLTMSADTGARPLDEIFDGLGGAAPRDALERLRADPGAVTFGDESVMLGTGGRDGRPYARIARDDDHLTFGQGRVSQAEGDLIRADRSIYGLSGRMSGDRGTVEGFVSSEKSLPQTDEFATTGGASYRLSHRDILPGTTQLSVERRDENGRLLERRSLVEGVDYRVNHAQGHVLLDRPLVETPTGALFAGEDEELVLRADYARPAQGVEDSVAGLRARQQIGGGFSIGATALRDGTGDEANTVTGLDLRHDAARGLSFGAEFARSEGRGRAIEVSQDGGLSFATREAGAIRTQADAWRVEAEADLERLMGREGHATAWAERREAGFAGDGAPLEEVVERSGVEVETVIAAGTRLGFGAERTRRGEEETDELRATLEQRIGARGHLSFGVERQRETGPGGTGARTDLAARLGRELGDDARAYLFAEGSVEASGTLEGYDRYGAGISGRITERLSAEAELGFGSAGTGLEAGLTYARDDGEIYLRQRIAGDETAEITGHDLVLGARRALSDDWSVFTEQDVLIGTSERKRGQSYGLDWTPGESLAFDVAASIDETGEAARRRTLSFGAESRGDRAAGRLRLELHDDDVEGASDSRGVLLAASTRRVTADEGGTLRARVEYAREVHDDAPDGAYAEAGLSYALRPVENDALVAVLSYDMRVDLERGAVGAADADSPLQRSHVFSADVDYRVTRDLTLGAKYGVRLGEVAFDRDAPDWDDSPAHIFVLRGDWSFAENWDLLVEYRSLWQPEQKTRDHGVLVAPYYQVNDHVRIGAGYNFGSFSDDLTDYDHDDRGVFVNAIYSF